jgi:hypothetical protein
MAKITLADGMVIEGTIEEFKQMGVEFPVKENTEAEKWAEIGRKPNEFKEGDFVKYKKCFAEVTRVGIYDMSIEAPNGIIPVAFESAILITPVEARFDH